MFAFLAHLIRMLAGLATYATLVPIMAGVAMASLPAEGAATFNVAARRPAPPAARRAAPPARARYALRAAAALPS